MKRVFIVKSILLLSLFRTTAQNVNSIPQTITNNYPVEKIYFHFDKDHYKAGETIWFKAYLYTNNNPNSSSSNFYIHFADSKGEVIESKRYPIENAAVKGDISIPDSISPGNYYIHGYTASLLNRGREFIQSKRIYIGDSSCIELRGNNFEKGISLQFFPEGGSLVDGIPNVMAFKASNQDGSPVKIKGEIRADEGVLITTFSSYQYGIGKLIFKPKAGRKYYADVQTADGKTRYALPAVLDSGVTLKVENGKGEKKFTLSHKSLHNIPPADLLLSVKLNNDVVYEREIFFDGYSSVIGHLITDSLPSGILRFTLFSSGKPVAERLSFVDNGEYRSQCEIELKKSVLNETEDTIELIFPDTLQRNISISVSDVGNCNTPSNDNIYSHFLLTSYLKEYVFNPSYYFESDSDSVSMTLDNLLLTHKWDRYSQEKTPGNQLQEKKYNDSYLINISGQVNDGLLNKPVGDGVLDVLISSGDSALYSYSIQVNGGGKFLIDSLLIFGQSKIFYTYTDKKGKEKPVLIKLDTDELTETLNNAKFEISSEIFGNLNTGFKYKYGNESKDDKKDNFAVKILDSVVIAAKPKRKLDIINEKYTSELFSTGGKIKIDNINSPPVDKAMNALDFVLNRIPTIGVQYGTLVNRKNFSIQDFKEKPIRAQGPRTTTSGAMRFWEVGLFINEVPTDLIQLQSLRADQIAMVKFFEAGALGAGSSYPGGALVVYLNKEITIARNDKTHTQFFDFKGYSISKKFRIPDYPAPPSDSVSAGTGNITFYWDSNAEAANQSKKAVVKVYHKNFGRNIRIVAEGYDVSGRLISIKKQIYY
ncbi:MAG: hypothetical protein JNK27_14280 [Chitinophagaceae bacterium]|nr:hypothetical protein [Chitinophagaceae bacterium]